MIFPRFFRTDDMLSSPPYVGGLKPPNAAETAYQIHRDQLKAMPHTKRHAQLRRLMMDLYGDDAHAFAQALERGLA